MNDLTTPNQTLPQPDREPFEVDIDLEAELANVDRSHSMREVPTNPKKIGKTVAHQLDERVRVMQDRHESFLNMLAEVGVVDSSAIKPGMRGTYITALGIAEQIEPLLNELRDATTNVKDTFDSL